MIEDEDEERIMPEEDADFSVCYVCTKPTANHMAKHEVFTHDAWTTGRCICKKVK